MLGQKVLIRIQFKGKDIDTVRKILEDIHQITSKKWTREFLNNFYVPAPGSTTRKDFSQSQHCQDFMKQLDVARSAAAKLKAKRSLNVDGALFDAIRWLIESSLPLGQKRLLANKEINPVYRLMHELALFMDDLIKRVIEEEVEFIKHLKVNLEKIEQVLAQE